MEETEIMMEIAVEYATFLPLGRHSKHVWAMGWVVCGVWYGPPNSQNKTSVEPKILSIMGRITGLGSGGIVTSLFSFLGESGQ